ncbi:MAG: sulfurtransferase [Candidatus Marinimicrobia bacterium]|nr:sulfurtransferase [Candidatus Neomarinimicrobiota bacterium]MCF7922153.1 sulfurtransferase [Candidatus Neomarinimicrobiota bacterium]
MGRAITLAQFIHHYERGNIRILDVREAWEVPSVRGENVIQIPVNQLPHSIDLIPQTEDLIVICQHGVRSKAVIEFLESKHGFQNLIDLQGGVSSYTSETS